MTHPTVPRSHIAPHVTLHALAPGIAKQALNLTTYSLEFLVPRHHATILLPLHGDLLPQPEE